MSRLAVSALLVACKVSTWSARKFDKSVTLKVERDHSTSADAGRWTKRLMGDAAVYKAVLKAGNQARESHYKQTLPWSDEGWRLLPTKAYFDYMKTAREAVSVFEGAVASFVDAYPTLRECDKVRLGTMWSADDYPDVLTLRDLFAIETATQPIAEAGDFRVSLPDEEIAELEQAAEARQRAALALAMRDAWQRLCDVTQHMADRLATPDAIFRDSLVDNVTEVCELLPKLNVTEDPGLARMVEEVRQRLTVVAPAVLRTDERARAAVAAQADQLVRTMQGYAGRREVA